VSELLLGFALGLAVAVVTTPVGVSGAVFLLPAQLTVLGVPSPSVTPTNLLFNVVAVPGGLWRYGRLGTGSTRLARRLLAGAVPGVVAGAVVRVVVLPGPTVFRVVVAVLLVPLGAWLVLGGRQRDRPPRRLTARDLALLGFGAGAVGGVYGIGGGSLLAPVLVGLGYAVIEVAPAALLVTFLTSVAGAGSFTVLALAGHEAAAPDWSLGVACGLGGLAGGYLGAGLQGRIPAAALRRLLGVLAVAVGVLYVVAVTGG
jgi:uncharacterized membrane protein YfcA